MCDEPLVSSCCGYVGFGAYEDLGLCPCCKEHCEYIEIEEDEDE